MTAILLALAASISYGAADFTGGFTTRRVAPLVVVLLSQLAGLGLLLLLTPLIGLRLFHATDLAWGAGAGVIGGAGVMLLYRALATGRMTVIAPVTALEAAAIPVLYGLLTGERPSAIALAGVVVGFVAVTLVSWSSEHPEGKRRGLAQEGVLDALGAGFGFGVFFILLSRASQGNALWALLGVKMGSLALSGTGLLLLRQKLRVPPGTSGLILIAGVFDMGANLLYLVATRSGLLSLVAVLTSMYPATTVILARFVLKERLERVQLSGLTLAVVAILMIARG
ncbi:MAG: DMT family transporter [Actinomycetota bacterium]|nr:DMT family transporter [Actinomycetota bacterium]